MAATMIPEIELFLSQRSLESGFHMIAITAAIAELFFYLSDRRDHMEIGLKCLLKMWLAATCAVHPLVQPLPQSFFL